MSDLELGDLMSAFKERRNFCIITDSRQVIPCTLDEHVHWLLSLGGEDSDAFNAKRRVGWDRVGPYDISTVCLFIDHGFYWTAPRLFFETMVFYEDDLSGIEQDRYSTWEIAEAEHKRYVDMYTRKWRRHQRFWLKVFWSAFWGGALLGHLATKL